MPSLRHRFFGWALKRQGFPERFEQMVDGPGLKRHYPRKHKGGQKEFEGFPFLWFDPPGERKKAVIVALHGGGYISEAQPPHLSAYAKMAKMTGMRVYAPYYPLAPEHGPEAILGWTRRFIDYVLEHNADPPLLLTGDSAGANLALHMIRDGVKAERLVLWSPWVDMEMENPELVLHNGKCALLELGTIGKISHNIADKAGLRAMSPIFWDSEDLPPTLVISGDHDLFHPDIEAWVAKRRGQGADITLDTQPDLFHDYVIFPTPEGKRAQMMTADFLSA